ncbi:MAG: hypothetical protein AAGN82_15760 [Myxococcota bacterium]
MQRRDGSGRRYALATLGVTTAATMTVASACVIPDLRATGKACPCGAELVCDPCTATCVPAGSERDNCDSDPLAAVQVTNLIADWSTPNVIRWSWQLGADDVPDQLVGFRLVVATSVAEVMSESGSARVYTNKDSPELRAYYLRHTNGLDPVISTFSDQLEPSTLYFARLVATDTAGRVSATNVAQQRTQEPAVGSLDVFDGDEVAATQPALDFSTMCATPARGCYSWQCEGDAPCYENLRLRPAAFTLGEHITEGQFATTAFLEVTLEVQGSPSDWSEIRLWLQAEAGPHRLNGVTFRGDADLPGPRVYQVPLRVLQRGGDPLAYATIESPVYETGVGLSLDARASATIHRLRFVW